MKKVIYLSLLSVLVSACVTKEMQGENEVVSSLKGLTRNIAQFEGAQPAQVQSAQVQPAAVINDPYILNLKEGKTLDCRTQVRTRTFSFNGKSYTKYIIDNADKLRCPQVRAFKTQRPWLVKKTEWTEADEQGFSAFVKALGDSKCNNTDSCISGPGNPLRTEEDMKNVFYADCADFPYYLRAYYAYKNSLPFSFVSSIKAAPFTQTQIDEIARQRAAIVAKDGEEAGLKFDKSVADLRYSRNGNLPVGRLNVPASTGVAREFGSIGLMVNDVISSGFFRMYTADPDTGSMNDFYSPRIQAGSIRPGTAVYAIAGHVGIISSIASNGEVEIMDAHPDNSITHKKLSPNEYLVDSPKKGGNFKNFRSLSLSNPQYDKNGNIIKAKTNLAKDEMIQDFSLEQYDAKNFTINGQKVKFIEWQKYRVSGGTYRVKPAEEISNEIFGLCSAFKDRVADVDAAVNNGLHTQAHIDPLPHNIFGAEGDWETFSSPSRDLRLRIKVQEIVETAKELARRVAAKDSSIDYTGVNVKADMVAAYKSAAATCKVTYTKSDKTKVSLNLIQLLSRLSQISFDPYMCPEVRWGATAAAELATCRMSADKHEWHKYTQFLRNNLVKSTTEFHGYKLDQLKKMDAGKQIDNNPAKINYNLEQLLSGI